MAGDALTDADYTRVLDGVVDEDERVILGLVIDAGGSAFQSDLVERSGFSKGKVSLVLDRLEARAQGKGNQRLQRQTAAHNRGYIDERFDAHDLSRGS